MKILYAIQGTGNGHASRALEIIPLLKEKAEVDILISGSQCDIKLPFDIKYQLYGLSFMFGKTGGINLFQTLKKIKLLKLRKEIKSIPIEDYDLVINDFEPISAWAAKLKNVPIISLSHQNAVLDSCSPTYKKYTLEKYILKYYAPTKMKFGFHFKSYNSSIFTPIIRHQIREKNINNKGHYTVYLPAYSDKKIIKMLSKFPIVKWQVFSRNTDKYHFKKNVTIQPINNFDFVKSMASSSGILCGAGFETPAEALYLGKKLLVIPMRNQYEQQCNALALKEMGIPVLKKLNTKGLKIIAHWIQSNEAIRVDYPDITEEILEAIISPYYSIEGLTTI
jgi:uncharacterized protein (TIGR00661 family)